MKKILTYIGAAVVLIYAAQFLLAGVPDVQEQITTNASVVQQETAEAPDEAAGSAASAESAESKASGGHKNTSGREHENNYHWGNHNTLQDHFDRHGGDFKAKDPQEYAKLANELFENRENYQVKVDDDGVIRVYDEETNSFGAYNKNGSTRSFFKPSDAQDYFDRQPGE